MKNKQCIIFLKMITHKLADISEDIEINDGVRCEKYNWIGRDEENIEQIFGLNYSDTSKWVLEENGELLNKVVIDNLIEELDEYIEILCN